MADVPDQRTRIPPSSYGKAQAAKEGRINKGMWMRRLGRAIEWLLDSVLLFCSPTAKQNWENRGLMLLVLVVVAVAVWAKIHHGF